MVDGEHTGKRIQEVRINKGLSRAALAARSGVSLTALQNWEEGRTASPRAKNLAKVAGALDVEIIDLTGETLTPATVKQIRDEVAALRAELHALYSDALTAQRVRAATAGAEQAAKDSAPAESRRKTKRSA